MNRLAVVVLCAGAFAAHAQDPETPVPVDAPVDAAVDPPSGDDPAEPVAAPTTGKSATDEGIDLTLRDRIKALARKTFLKAGRFELSPQAGVSVNDVFFRTWLLNLRGAYHFHDSFALELGGSFVPFLETQDPTRLLKREVQLINADAPLIGLADVSVTFSPLYGKFALFGDTIIHFDGYVLGGVGATFDLGEDIVHPALNIGIGTKIFLTRWLVIRADIRDVMYPQDRKQISTLQNLIFVNLGVGFFFPFDFQYENEAARVNRNG
jgi:outer membrane beta-barrel protein